MYKTIYIPVDNSDHSNMAVELGVSLAKTFGSKLVGSHVYAAKMHDKRFKQMEAGLPEEYHDEKELDRQRQIHDSLITRGLQIITDSYLDFIDKKCTEANLPLERRSLEGRNWKVLAEDINTNGYELVIMGALGVGAVKDSVIGSNTERVVRRVRQSDMLIIKDTKPMNGGKIVVAVDGSPYSFGGLMTGLALGKALNKPVEAIAAFDPYFHYAAFHSISGVLNEEAGKVFRGAAPASMDGGELVTDIAPPGFPMDIAVERPEEFGPGLDPELLALVQATAELELKDAEDPMAAANAEKAKKK